MPDQDNSVPRGRLRRTVPLAGFAARAAGGRLAAELRERTGDDGAVERFHERTADRYAELLGNYRGVLMKVGQMLSLVDAEALSAAGYTHYQRALGRLQADAPAMEPATVRNILESEFSSPSRYFADFSDEPIAAASIGQVHRAVLRDGRDVAVKIQYPGVAEAIQADLANTEMLASMLRFMTSAVGAVADFRVVAREASARISEEVDYRHEAAMIERFGELYEGHPFIRVPEIVREACTDRVLTMTYLDGMDWAAAQQADQDVKNTWAETILRFGWGNFRHANLLYADPHPGNYRFNPDGTVGFVDFGCVRVLSEEVRRSYVAVVRAAIEGRSQDVRALMVESGWLAADSALTADKLQAWWSDMLHEVIVAPQPATYTAETTTRNVRALFDVRDMDHPLARMNVPEEFVFAGRVQLAISSVLGTLRATLPVRAIVDDADGVAEPVTGLGVLHRDWLRDRGLPSGLGAG